MKLLVPPTIGRRSIGKIFVVLLGLFVLSAAPEDSVALAPAEALPAEAQRYLKALGRVCESRVTPELVRLYEEARKAVDAGKYGGGRGSDFGGLRSPEDAQRDCFQGSGSIA